MNTYTDPANSEVIIENRCCEFCPETMHYYSRTSGLETNHYFICNNIDCDNYDISVEAETYYEGSQLIVE